MKDLRIFCCGKIVDGGPIAWDLAPLPDEPEPEDGDLQRTIDEAMDDMRFDGSIEEDQLWISRGC